jgi:hypothetical protein
MHEPKIDALVAKMYPDLCDHLRPESEQCLLCEIDVATAAIQRVRGLAEKFERDDGPVMDYRTAANRVRGALDGESND